MPLGADTPIQASRKFHRLAQDVKQMDRRVVEAGALTLKRSVQSTLAVAAPRARLNVGKRGAKVGVRYDTPTQHTAVVRMTGPAHLLESDTKAHRIPRGTIGRGRRQRANTKKVVIPGIGVRAYVNHPGTKGKHPWAKGLRAGLPKVEAASATVLKETIGRVFR